MKYLIQHLKQLNDRRYIHNETVTDNLWNNSFLQTPIHSLEQMNSQFEPRMQQRIASIWPTMLQPATAHPTHSLPHFNCKNIALMTLMFFSNFLIKCNLYFSVSCSGYDHFEMIATANKPISDFPRTHTNLTIVDQDMDGAVAKWLHYLKLHKYQWFFNGLSYLEIEIIEEDNIEAFITKVNLNSITKGAQKKICISTKTLRDRPLKLKDLILVTIYSL